MLVYIELFMKDEMIMGQCIMSNEMTLFQLALQLICITFPA